MSTKPSILATSAGPLIAAGIARLSKEEETALNLLLRKAGGADGDMQFYRLGWAMEDNYSRYDPNTGEFAFDIERKTPVCVHPHQASYHLLAWEPPSSGLLAYEKEMKGEDLSKGTYNCILHFMNPETNQPIRPTMHLLDLIIPVMKQFNEIAFAARGGFEATRDRLRMERVRSMEEREQRKRREYDAHADALLEDSAPAFEGNPTSFPGAKRQTFSDLMPGERQVESSADASEAPNEFVFSVRSRAKEK